VLGWEIASEIDLLGFNVYWAESADGQRMRLNEAFLPAQVPSVTYWYWPAAVDAYGVATEHRLVSATADGVTSDQTATRVSRSCPATITRGKTGDLSRTGPFA
jgi:hypothetical protein